MRNVCSSDLISCNIDQSTYACVLYIYIYIYLYMSALGVLCCFALFVCLTLLASFFHLSFKNMYIYTLFIYMYMYLKTNREIL